MKKRAAIYVRVSSERQAEGVSPDAQETDCRVFCTRNGYEVVEVYRDTEKYRVRGRLVEPSGTRSDRPQFVRMLKDFNSGAFDVLVSWREDRLYRGVTRAVIELKERVKHQGLTIEITNGGFNPQTMEVLAWAAGVENEARIEQRNMGMAHRLALGKLCLNNPIYGYDYDATTGSLVVNETEAYWVRQMWLWYGAGVSRFEIRSRLIAAGAPQSNSSGGKRKYVWSMNIIDNVVHRDSYYSGIFITKWNGQEYEATIPKLIDADIYQPVLERRLRWKAFPAGNLRQQALVAGLVYCRACGTMTAVISRTSGTRRYLYYKCNSFMRRTFQEGCIKYARMDIVDATVWDRVWSLISEPAYFEHALQDRIAELQNEDADAEKDMGKLERQLDEVLLERQQVISFVRKSLITEDDLETQLLSLTRQEQMLRRELSSKSLLTGNRVARLLDVASIYREYFQTGMEAIKAQPETEDQATRQFQLRRKIIEALVKRVVVANDKSVVIEVEIDLPNLSVNPVASSWH